MTKKFTFQATVKTSPLAFRNCSQTLTEKLINKRQQIFFLLPLSNYSFSSNGFTCEIISIKKRLQDFHFTTLKSGCQGRLILKQQTEILPGHLSGETRSFFSDLIPVTQSLALAQKSRRAILLLSLRIIRRQLARGMKRSSRLC